MPDENRRLAVIDMGSNAIRLQISTTNLKQTYARFKRVEYVRFPLRLGHEAFTKRQISEQSVEKILDLMHAYQLLMKLYEVDDYMACATSAMREAKNGKELAARIQEAYGINLEVISGQRESEILGKSIEHLTEQGSFVHVDVGGGSTEINFYENRQKLAGRSFPLGAVRQLEATQRAFDSEEMFEWIRKQTRRFKNAPKAIGTGGNINKFRSILGRKEAVYIPFKEIEDLHRQLADLSYEQRMDVFNLNADRADVIVTAGQIYLTVIRAVGAKKVLAPNVGLREGMLRLLMERAR